MVGKKYKLSYGDFIDDTLYVLHKSPNKFVRVTKDGKQCPIIGHSKSFNEFIKCGAWVEYNKSKEVKEEVINKYIEYIELEYWEDDYNKQKWVFYIKIKGLDNEITSNFYTSKRLCIIGLKRFVNKILKPIDNIDKLIKVIKDE